MAAAQEKFQKILPLYRDKMEPIASSSGWTFKDLDFYNIKIKESSDIKDFIDTYQLSSKAKLFLEENQQINNETCKKQFEKANKFEFSLYRSITHSIIESYCQ